MKPRLSRPRSTAAHTMCTSGWRSWMNSTPVGAATMQPLPDYTPIAVPANEVIPGFYDSWSPGYHTPPLGSRTPPPPPE